MGAITGEVGMADDYEKEQTDKMSKEDKATYKTWSNKCRAEWDARTLTEAMEVKEDKERFKMAIAYAKDQVKNIKKVSNMGDDD